MSNAIAETYPETRPPQVAARGRVIDALARLLETGDEADRCYACRALGEIGAREAVPALRARLKDEDVDVCVDAAEALGLLADPTAIPALLDSLQNDPDGEVKTAITEALGQLGGEAVIEALLSVAAGRPEHMVFDDADSWDCWWDMQLKAVEALGRMNVSHAAPVLDAILDDEEGQDIDAAVLKSLACIGPEGEQRLARRLSEGDTQGRRRVATALAHARSPAALKMLGDTVLDESTEVRVAALEALAKAGATPYLPAILHLHRDSNPEVRATAARCGVELAACAGASNVPVAELVTLASDPASEVRRIAMNALARAQTLPDEVRTVAESALGDSDDLTAIAACQVVSRFGDEAACLRVLDVLADSNREPRVRGAAARTAGSMVVHSPAAMEGLTRAIVDDEQSVRLAALSALMNLGSSWPSTDAAGPLDVVTAALRGSLVPPEAPAELPVRTGSVRSNAVTDENHANPDRHLAEEEERAGNVVMEAARTPVSTLEAIAMHNAESALGRDEPGMRLDGAIAGQETPSGQVEDFREYAQIVEFNERTAEWLFARGAGPMNIDVRRLAARVVGGARYTGAVPALVEALSDDDLVLRTEAAASIALIAGEAGDSSALYAAIGPLLAACKHSDRDLRAAAARALGAVGHRDGYPSLESLLTDSDTAVRIQAVQALANLQAGSQTTTTDARLAKTFQKLLPMLDDPIAGVRKATLSALLSMLQVNTSGHDEGRVATAIDCMLDAGFAGDGGQARDVARALKCVDRDEAAEQAVERLGELATSAERRVAIEILAELCKA